MINILKKNIHSVLVSACCSVLMLCEGVNGMDNIDAIKSQSKEISFLPIAIDFPCFLGSLNSSNPSSWPKALENISSCVSALHEDQYDSEIECACLALHYLSIYFDNFVKFCKSESCNTANRAIVFSLISLAPKVLNNLLGTRCSTLKGQEDIENLIDDFSAFVKPLQSSSLDKPLVTEEQRELFFRLRVITLAGSEESNN